MQEDYYTPVKICGWIGDISQPLAVRPRNVKSPKVSRGFQITIVDEDSQRLQTLIIPITEDTKKYYDIKEKISELYAAVLLCRSREWKKAGSDVLSMGHYYSLDR